MHVALAIPTVVLCSIPLAFAMPQDKPKKLPTPPQGAKPLPPVLEPVRSPVERRDLLQKFHKRQPIEGIYQLKRMVLPGGRLVAGGRGYLFVGQRHLSMQLYAPKSKTDANLFCATRRYRINGDKLEMSGLLGHRNKPNGAITLEPKGYQVMHRFTLSGSVLRIYRARDEYLDFERVE